MKPDTEEAYDESIKSESENNTDSSGSESNSGSKDKEEAAADSGKDSEETDGSKDEVSEPEEPAAGKTDESGKSDATDASSSEDISDSADIHDDTGVSGNGSESGIDIEALLAGLEGTDGLSEEFQLAVVEGLEEIKSQQYCQNFLLAVIVGILLGKLILGRLK